jgi:hypothetical protein
MNALEEEGRIIRIQLDYNPNSSGVGLALPFLLLLHFGSISVSSLTYFIIGDKLEKKEKVGVKKTSMKFTPKFVIEEGGKLISKEVNSGQELAEILKKVKEERAKIKAIEVSSQAKEISNK